MAAAVLSEGTMLPSFKVMPDFVVDLPEPDRRIILSVVIFN
jgi:hypothetical protein